jgi:NAD(P)-dependent dehydrogenase (short-subunit alcohol dehydrogenase family)
MTANVSRVAVVTGAAGGIGRATVSALASDGWSVVALDRAADPTANVRACDITNPADVERVVAEVTEQHGHVDAVVNAAGVGSPVPFESASDEIWQQVFEVNLFGTVRMCREFLPLLRKSDWEHRSIVLFTSQAAKTGGLLIGAPYSAAKAAVLCLTMSLAGEFGPEGIRVNGVAPGIVETAFLDNVPGIRDRSAGIPLRRLGRPSEVADVVRFLVSPSASYLTGETIDVNGGIYMD